MKRVLFGLLALTICTTTIAQKNDPEAKKLLDAVSAKFKALKTVEAAFTIKSENAAGKTLGAKKGVVRMKGSKYKINMGNNQIFCDGKNVWNYSKSVNEVAITQFDNSSATLTPQKMFTNFYDKDFLYKKNGDKTIDGKVATEIELTPKDKNKPFFKVYIYVSAAESLITSTKVLMKTGNKDTYTFSGIKQNPAVADAEFLFSAAKFPGVEINDLR
jgi:outer membrane lipoprotein carrier protein